MIEKINLKPTVLLSIIASTYTSIVSTKQSCVRNRLFQVKLTSCPRLVARHTDSPSYNLAFKLKIVAEAEAVENNSEIAREYGTSESMAHCWRKDQANLFHAEVSRA